MHQRLAVITSYLRQPERTGQLHSCSCLGQSERPDGESCVDRCGETHFLHSVKCGPMLCLFFHLMRAGYSGLEWVFWSSRLFLLAEERIKTLEKGDNLCWVCTYHDTFGRKPTRQRTTHCSTQSKNVIICIVEMNTTTLQCYVVTTHAWCLITYFTNQSSTTHDRKHSFS